MVTPQWGSFQKPNQIQNQEEKEIDSEIPGKINDQMKSEGEKPQWGNFQSPETYQGPKDPTEGENNLNYFIRNIVTNSSRLLEQGIGRYGNIEKFGKEVLSNFPKSGGILGWAISELVGQENWEKLIRGSENKQMFPTSETLKKASHFLTNDYTKAKTPGEEKFQGFIEDIGSTLSLRRIASGQIPTARQIAINNLGIPAASNVVQNVVEDLGFGKDKATVAKLGTWTALSLLGNVNANQFASNLMNRGRNGIPQNLPINVPRMQQRLQTLSNDPHLLNADPRTALARQQIAAVEKDLANGQNTVRSFMTAYDGINAAKRNRDLFSLNRTDQEFARRAIDKVRNVVKDEIMQSGAAHPEALNHWKSGIEAWAVIHQTKAMTNWIDSLARGPYAKILSGPAAGLFGISSFGAFKAPLIAAPSAIAIPAAYKSIQVGIRAFQNKNLAQYYWNAVNAAQKENLPAFLNNYNKLNKGLKKSDSTEKKTKSKKN